MNKELEAVKKYIARRMNEDIPEVAFAAYNDIRVFIWGMERAKEANYDRSAKSTRDE